MSISQPLSKACPFLAAVAAVGTAGIPAAAQADPWIDDTCFICEYMKPDLIISETGFVSGYTYYAVIKNDGLSSANGSWASLGDYYAVRQWFWIPALAAGASYRIEFVGAYQNEYVAADAWNNYVAEFDENNNWEWVGVQIN